MAARTVNGKRLYIQQLPSSSAPTHESNSNVISDTAPPSPSTSQSTKTYTTRTELVPKTRIVVVRTTSTAQSQEGETIESNETARSKSVELPPVFTDGRTSVYLIRRPIPPNEQPVQTQMFKRSEDDSQQISTTTTITTKHSQNIHTPMSTEDIVSSPSLHQSPSLRPESPTIHSPVNTSPRLHSSILIDSENPKQSEISQRRSRRSRSKSRTRNLVRSDSKSRPPSKHRSRSARRLSPSGIHHEEWKDTNRQDGSYSFPQTKSTSIQANLPSSDTRENEYRTDQHVRRTRTKIMPRKISAGLKAKSFILVNPEDNTIAVIENTYIKGDTIKHVTKRPKSSKKTRFRGEADSQSTEKLVKTSRWYTCLGCLSRHMCLIIVICLILALIGLTGVGVSAYFLSTNSQNNSTATIVGIVVGGVLAIAALCFLCCIVACIGSRDGYFSYKNKGSHRGGRAFALIPPSHPNAHLYIPRDHMEMNENNQALSSINFISNTQKHIIHRQKTVLKEGNGTSNAKNITIEMPERLLTGRKMSPKSQERNLNKVVKNIGHAVDNAKRRHNGEVINKVIVKVDTNAKPTT